MNEFFSKSHFLSAMLSVFALFAVVTAFQTDITYNPSWVAARAFGDRAAMTAMAGNGIILAQDTGGVTTPVPGGNSTVTTQVPGNNSTISTQVPGNNSTITTQLPAASQAPASGQTSPQSTFTLTNPLNSKFNSVGSLVDGFVTIFAYLVVILAVIMIIWTGLQYIFAAGNTEKMKKASIQLGYIVIGVAIVIGARLIIHIVINTLQATGTVNSNVINSANNAINSSN